MFAVSEPHVRLAINVTPEAKADTLALIRAFDRVHGPLIQQWVPFVLANRYAEDVWTQTDPERPPSHKSILERDDYRCMVPGCRRRATIECNHIKHRARGGSDEPCNIHALCHFHHRLFHEGYLRITGEAPDKVRFEFGIRPNGKAIIVTIGDLIIERDDGHEQRESDAAAYESAMRARRLQEIACPQTALHLASGTLAGQA